MRYEYAAAHSESINGSLSAFGEVRQHFGRMKEVAMGNVELPKKLTLLPASRFAAQILLYERRMNLRRRDLDCESTRTH
jgi:hypothetical protein